MKKIPIMILILVLIFNILSVSVSASDAVSWYVRKNGNSRPQLCDEQKIIYNYDGYYIDEKLTDTSEKKVIYITFDAGYENGNVEKILDTLKEKGVPSAFFVLDHIIIKNTDLVKRMSAEGHTVCNHTKNHKDMTALSREQMAEDLAALERIYEEKTGEKMSKYFRFPEGKYSEKSLSYANELGYKTIFWSFGYPDWDNERQPNPDQAFDKIISSTHNGMVILLHPNSKTNAEIMPRLIDKWREMGYSFGTLDELVEK